MYVGCRLGPDRSRMLREHPCHGHSRVVTRIIPELTSREIEVLRLLSRGYTYLEIGGKLGISVHTVTSHIKKSYRKLGAHSAAAAVTRAADLGLLGKSRDG